MSIAVVLRPVGRGIRVSILFMVCSACSASGRGPSMTEPDGSTASAGKNTQGSLIRAAHGDELGNVATRFNEVRRARSALDAADRSVRDDSN